MSVSLSADAYTAMMTEMNADKSEIKKLKEDRDASAIALDIVKEENEINKKNMFRFQEENKKLKTELDEATSYAKDIKEVLADKFYKFYKEMDYNLPNVCRTIGPDLGRMVDAMMKDNKKMEEENKTSWQEGYDRGESENSVDTEYLEEKDEEIEKLKKELLGFRSVCDSLSLPELTDDCLMEYINKLKNP